MELAFATARPSPDLMPYLRALHGARLSGAAPERQLELPVAGTAVVLAMAHRWSIAAAEDAPPARFGSFAGGLSLGPAVSEHTGAYELVELVLTPVGTAAVLGVPAAELAGLVVELADVVGPAADRLVEHLAGLPGWAERFAAVEAWLRRRVADAPERLRPDVEWALGRVDATGGRVTIGTLQSELGCSSRHLSARFAQEVGATPKAYAQLVRFTGAAARLRAGATPGDVAAACGYADQAHLAREVRRFGATTPTRLRPVTSVQDTARTPA